MSHASYPIQMIRGLPCLTTLADALSAAPAPGRA
jgi:hypothetical protein